MKNNTEKLTETKLTISLRTGLMHSNKREEAHTQNDFTSFYIGAINYFIRIALEAESLLEQQTESKAFVNDAQFRENMQFLVQISEGLSEWLPDYSTTLRKDIDEQTENEQLNVVRVHSPVADLPEQPAESQQLDKLAVQISELLKNPTLPVELYNAILHGTDDIINSSNFADNAKYETSPEHIKAVLKISKS
jgi:hypothetical protein